MRILSVTKDSKGIVQMSIHNSIILANRHNDVSNDKTFPSIKGRLATRKEKFEREVR